MERSKGVVLAAGILFLFGVWSLFLSGLALGGGFGAGAEVAGVSEALARRFQIVRAMSGVLDAGILILVGIGVYSLVGWSRPLGLVLAFWWGILSLMGFFIGEGSVRVGNMILFPAALLLIGTLFNASVKVALSPKKPRPRGLTVLGALYFIHGLILSLVAATPLVFLQDLPLWSVVAGFLVLAFLVSIYLLLGIGILELRPWARTWILIFSWITVGLMALGWVALLARGPSGGDVGSYVAWNLIGLPISVFALWYLTRSHVKERFLVPL